MMTKRVKIWLVLLLVGAGITAGGAGYMKYQEHKEREAMLEIVRSEEAREAYYHWFTSADSKAMTDAGIIKTYSIDDDSIKRNPMGGISVRFIINDNPNLYIQCIIDKDTTTGKLISESSNQSPELANLLEKVAVND